MKNVEDIYPLTPMQQGMLFHSLYAPESGIYVEQVSFALRGRLDAAALRQAIQTAIDRNPVLRTGFTGEGLKEPVQVVYRQVEQKWREEDWSELSAGEQEQRFETYLEKDRTAGFNLARPPLARAALIRTGADASYFVFTNHHILMDGWSVPVLLGEIFSLYDAYANQQKPALPQPRPFREYVRWLQQQDTEKARQFWQENLRGFIAPTPLVCTHPQPVDPASGESFGDEEYFLSRELTASLQALTRKLQITLSTLVAASWSLLLSRYSGEPDIIFGMTTSGRPPDLPGSETMIGLFINTLPVRVKIDPQQTVSAWLKELQAAQVEMRQYEYSSLVQIKQWSEVPPDQPLFETLMVFENYPTSAALQDVQQELRIERVRSHEQTHFPLALIAGPGDQLFLRLIYETPRFNRETALAMLRHLEMLLSEFCAHPEDPVRRLAMVTEEERRLILDMWNDTAAPFADSACIHQLFEQQAARSPNAPALVFGDTCLTYRELNERANRLAYHLLALGLQTEAIAGICLERSPDQIIAMLAILKASGAYVPIDPAYPPDRIRFILEDSGVKLVLTHSRLAETAASAGAELVLVDQLDLAGRLADNPVCTNHPDGLAYVIYTSGSTGKPKGVLLRHRGLCNFNQANAHYFDVGPGTRFLQYASLSFDASLSEIITALTYGACLVMITQEVVYSPEALQELMQRQHVTTAILPPSVLEYLNPEDLPELRNLGSAGEKCPVELAAKWVKGRCFYNAYGPTEATVGPTIYRVPEDIAVRANVPIGRPICNMYVYILDREQQLLPPGIPGEICIGGVGISLGYLNRPELTTVSFIPDPYARRRGERLYRTGDLGRFLPDGNIEYLGRLDHQIKIRGFRIELEEIESALSSHPAVRQAAVVVHGSGPDQRLTAYFVPEDGEPAIPAELRAFLSNKLPNYMLPSSYLPMTALPLTPNGKTDRKALAGMEQDPSALNDHYLPPRDTLEFQLVKIWEEVLNVSPVGVRDSFFELGGHSLLAVRITAQVQKKLGKEVPVIALFQEPTIEHMASLLRQDSAESYLRSLVEIQPVGDKRPLFFIHPSGGSVHWYFELSQALGVEQPFYGLQARGLNGDCEIDRRIPDMAAHYIEEIRSVQPEGPYAIGSWSMGVMIAYEIAQQLQASGQQVALLALLDQGPVLPAQPPEDDAEYYLQAFGKNVPLDIDHLRSLTSEKQVEYVLAESKRVGWVFNEISLEEFSHFILMLRTHTEAWRQYQVRPYHGKVTLFRADNQDDPSAAPDLGWGALAENVEVIAVPGDHLSMVHHPDVTALAQKIQGCLEAIPHDSEKAD